MKWWPKECAFGDMIRVKINSIYHYGIFVSENEVIQFGLPPVNIRSLTSQDTEVLSTDINTFSAGNIVEVGDMDRKEKKKARTPEKIVETARSRIGEKGYDLLQNNCEHFAYECVFGEKFSSGVDEISRKWGK